MQERQMQERREESQPTSSRGGFLRRLATLAAVGLGVTLVPGRARAQNGQCCNNQTACPDSNCTDPRYPYNWECSGCESGPCCHCTDIQHTVNCFNSPCPCP
jgi:hypothetical protein